jgi:hypothetical protein
MIHQNMVSTSTNKDIQQIPLLTTSQAIIVWVMQ